MYSQNDEEKTIGDLFGDSGRFLDVGAYDGVQFSNTRRLFERGWGGVLVEPSPDCFRALENNYRGSDRTDLVMAAVADSVGTIDFYDNGCLSSTSAKFVAEWPEHTFKKITVPTITWEVIFDEHGSDFDFVNIDTEGTNLEILRLFPFDRCAPKCICVEHERIKQKEMVGLLSAKGYRQHARTGENLIVVKA